MENFTSITEFVAVINKKIFTAPDQVNKNHEISKITLFLSPSEMEFYDYLCETLQNPSDTIVSHLNVVTKDCCYNYIDIVKTSNQHISVSVNKPFLTINFKRYSTIELVNNIVSGVNRYYKKDKGIIKLCTLEDKGDIVKLLFEHDFNVIVDLLHKHQNRLHDYEEIYTDGVYLYVKLSKLTDKAVFDKETYKIQSFAKDIVNEIYNKTFYSTGNATVSTSNLKSTKLTYPIDVIIREINTIALSGHNVVVKRVEKDITRLELIDCSVEHKKKLLKSIMTMYIGIVNFSFHKFVRMEVDFCADVLFHLNLTAGLTKSDIQQIIDDLKVRSELANNFKINCNGVFTFSLCIKPNTHTVTEGRLTMESGIYDKVFKSFEPAYNFLPHTLLCKQFLFSIERFQLDPNYKYGEFDIFVEEVLHPTSMVPLTNEQALECAKAFETYLITYDNRFKRVVCKSLTKFTIVYK